MHELSGPHHFCRIKIRTLTQLFQSMVEVDLDLELLNSKS